MTQIKGLKFSLTKNNIVFILDVWIFSSVSAIMSLLKLLMVCGTGLGLLLVIMMSRQNSVDDLRYKCLMTTFLAT